MPEYELTVRLEFYGTVTIEADSEDEARDKFHDGNFECDVNAMSMANWKREGRIRIVDAE